MNIQGRAMSSALAIAAVMAIRTDAALGQNAWTLLATSGPKARAGQAMVYDSVRRRAVLFGGYDDAPDYETWEWDGISWTLRATTGPNTSSGYSRAMAYDSARGRVVFFGGVRAQGGCLDDTYEWDGSTWSLRASTGPSARAAHAMAYDSNRRVTVLFGGFCRDDGFEYYDDTWEWDGGTWTLRAASGPSARTGHAMVYDSLRRRIVMFGGAENGSALRGDTWEWDGSTWVRLATSGPAARQYHAMAYDSGRAVTVLFGGGKAGGFDGETWEWDGSSWTLQTSSGPTPRELHAMAYDSAQEMSILFGGATQTELSDETWSYATPASCNGGEHLKPSCQDKDNDVPPEGDDLVKGKLTGGTPGLSYTFCLDGGRCSIEVASARGVAKTKWKNVSDGTHTVTVTECGLSELTACP